MITLFILAQKEAKKKTKRAKVAEKCQKVKSKSKEKYSEIHSSQELSHSKNALCNRDMPSQDGVDSLKSVKMDISSDKESSFSDSFNGLLDIPLFERIKSMPKALLQNNETFVHKIPGNGNDLIDILFDNSLNHTSLLDLQHSFLNNEKRQTGISLDFKISEEFCPSTKTNNADQVINHLFNDSEISSSSTNYNYVFGRNNGPKIENMDFSIDETNKSTPKKNVNNANSTNVKNTIYLDFSDSDDSFLSILNQGLKYHQSNVYSPEYIKVEKGIAKKCPFSIDSSTHSVKQDIFGLNAQNISTPLMNKPNLSPSTLYSLKHSISRTQKKVGPRFLLSEIFNNSSPKIEAHIYSRNSAVNSPNSFKAFPHVLFSPLNFDSSIDEL